MVALSKDLNKNTEIKIFSDLQDLFQTAANDFAQRAINAVNTKGIFNVALSGGNTPKYLFDILATKKQILKQIPWRNINFFLTDERYVPDNNPESNYDMMNKHLFSKIDINTENIYKIPTDYTHPKDAAEDYTATLRKIFDINHNEFPKFDLVYLGLGEDAHTASLMPFSNALDIDYKNNQLVESLWVPKLRQYRITLTAPAINQAACIIFLVTGANKASAVRSILEGSFEPQRYPAQLIHCVHGKTIWYLDHAAAEKLRGIET